MYDDSVPGTDPAFFEKTSWSTIRRAQGETSEDRDRALQTLFERYWRTVYVYARMAGRASEDAKDLTQQFFVRVLETNMFEHLDESRGRFRSFLKVALRNFLHDRHRAETAVRSGGARPRLSLEALADAERSLPSADVSPEEALDREWRRVLVSHALRGLASHYRSVGKEDRYRLFEAYYVDNDDGKTHGQLAEELGLSSAQVNNHLTSARRRFRGLLAKAVGDSVSDPTALAEELAELFGEEA